MPECKESVDLHTDSNFFLLNLNKAIYESMLFKSFNDNIMFSRLQALLHNEDEKQKTKKIKSLKPIEQKSRDLALLGSNMIYFGTPKLSLIKSHLVREGLKTEFIGGSLIVKSCISLRRVDDNRYLLEGILSQEYYKTRELLYSMLLSL